MQQVVIVIDIHEGEALVRSDQSGCQGCEAKSSCAVLSGQEKTKLNLTVVNTLRAKVGDRVVLAMDDQAILRATFVLYAVPMLAFMGSGLLMYALASSLSWEHVDLWAVVAACLGMAMVWKLTALFDFKPAVKMLHFDIKDLCVTHEERSDF